MRTGKIELGEWLEWSWAWGVGGFDFSVRLGTFDLWCTCEEPEYRGWWIERRQAGKGLYGHATVHMGLVRLVVSRMALTPA